MNTHQQRSEESIHSLNPALRVRGGGGITAGETSKASASAAVAFKNKKGDDGGSSSENAIFGNFFRHAAAIPPFLPFMKGLMSITVALYVLNQTHMLPKQISGLVSKALFWPTLPITVGKRIGDWTTEIDDTVILGGAPFGFVGLPDQLHGEGVRGVVNFCQEYGGPTHQYRKLGMKELRLPTIDHFEPSLEDLRSAVDFIESYKAKGERVYVHCRAGHGRSGAGVMAYLLAQDPFVDVQSLNEWLGMKRKVRKTLWNQPNIKQFHQELLQKMSTKSKMNKEKRLKDDDASNSPRVTDL